MTVAFRIRIRPVPVAHLNIKDRRFRDTALRHVTKGSRTLPSIPCDASHERGHSSEQLPRASSSQPESANIAAMPASFGAATLLCRIIIRRVVASDL